VCFRDFKECHYLSIFVAFDYFFIKNPQVDKLTGLAPAEYELLNVNTRSSALLRLYKLFAIAGGKFLVN
jgi:hypothetical protein